MADRVLTPRAKVVPRRRVVRRLHGRAAGARRRAVPLPGRARADRGAVVPGGDEGVGDDGAGGGKADGGPREGAAGGERWRDRQCNMTGKPSGLSTCCGRHARS